MWWLIKFNKDKDLIRIDVVDWDSGMWWIGGWIGKWKINKNKETKLRNKGCGGSNWERVFIP